MACVDLSFIRFGDCPESYTKTTFNINNLSKQVVNSVMSSVSTTETVVISSQEQNVIIRGSCCSQLKIDQTADIKVLDKTKVDATFKVQIGSQIKNLLTDEMNKKLPELAVLAGEENAGNLINTINTSISNVTETTSFQESIDTVLNKIVTVQLQNVNIECSDYIPMPPPTDTTLPKSTCLINQTFLAQIEINTLFEKVFSLISGDPNVIDAVNKIREQIFNEDMTEKIENRPKTWFQKEINTLIMIFLVFFIPIIISIIAKIIKKK
jgi:hypothetical protein